MLKDKSIAKAELNSYCIQLVKNRIETLNKLLFDARESANTDTKSSMGDKYETSRAMLQIEQENITKQLAEANNILSNLISLPDNSSYSTVCNGSLITTNTSVFYLSTGLGKIDFKGKELMVISPKSPIGQKLMGLKTNDTIDFNKTKYTILNIE